MALNNKDYLPSFAYGALVTGSQIASGAITSDLIANGSITGADLTLTKHYVTIAQRVLTGTGQLSGGVAVFGGTAPVNGTITGFWTNSSGTNGSAVLWATTAGTIAVISTVGTTSVFGGTSALNATVVAGDTVNFNNITGQGSFTGFITFVSAS